MNSPNKTFNDENMINKLVIIGVGLIGGSFALALSKLASFGTSSVWGAVQKMCSAL